MDYPCGKFGDFSFSRFGFILQTQRERKRESERDMDESHAKTAESHAC